MTNVYLYPSLEEPEPRFMRNHYRRNEKKVTRISREDVEGLGDLSQFRRDKFPNGKEYAESMNTRIGLEELGDQEICDKRKIEKLRLSRWKQEKDAVYAFFVSPSNDMTFSPGEKLSLQLNDWKATGTIDRVGKEVSILLDDGSFYPSRQLNNFQLKFELNGSMYNRMREAVSNFWGIGDKVKPSQTTPSQSAEIALQVKKMILGMPYTPLVLDAPKTVSSAPGLGELNDSQIKAIFHCLQHPLTLIQGPPGTGKTVTSANIAYHLRKVTESPVLLCAPSNVAVANLVDKILKIQENMKVVRVTAKSREGPKNDDHLSHLSLHRLVFERNEELKQLKNPELDVNERNRLMKLKEETEDKILKEADFVLCTCSVAGDRRLTRQKMTKTFKSCLIDECGQSVETETIIPIALTTGRVVLVGDQNQLGPTVKCPEAVAAGMDISLFERLINAGLPVIQLNVQYRMHPSISEFPSDEFYNRNIENGVKADERELLVFYPWKRREVPVVFFDIPDGQEKRQGTSWMNPYEAGVVQDNVELLFRGRLGPANIGIITPYDAQRTYLKNIPLLSDIEIASVDEFQGKEKEIIIMSCVRTHGIGFLTDKRRLNVALTRARSGVIVIGHLDNLKGDPLWKKFIQFMKKNDCIIKKDPEINASSHQRNSSSGSRNNGRRGGNHRYNGYRRQ